MRLQPRAPAAASASPFPVQWGKTALDIATEKKQTECIQLLETTNDGPVAPRH